MGDRWENLSQAPGKAVSSLWRKAESINTRTKRWAGLGMVAALAIALAAWLLPRGGDTEVTVGRPQRPPQLELVDLLMQEAGGGSRLEVVLHNTGDRRVVISGARIEIGRVYEAGHCRPQGDLPLSNTYGVQLSPSASPGTQLEAPLHQQLGGDEADRFQIAFGLPAEGAARPKVNYLFELDVSLLHDGSGAPLSLGRVLVALPYAPAPGEDFWTESMAEMLAAEFHPSDERWLAHFRADMRCWRSNTAVLRQALSEPSVRSRNLDAIPELLVTPSMAAIRAAAG